MSALHPDNPKTKLSPDESFEANVMHLAIRLNRLPHEVRNAPATDIYRLIDTLNADDEIQKVKQQKRRTSGNRGKGGKRH
jgi:hypothetical protein